MLSPPAALWPLVRELGGEGAESAPSPAERVRPNTPVGRGLRDNVSLVGDYPTKA